MHLYGTPLTGLKNKISVVKNLIYTRNFFFFFCTIISTLIHAVIGGLPNVLNSGVAIIMKVYETFFNLSITPGLGKRNMRSWSRLKRKKGNNDLKREESAH